jgi:hypothetical protein
MAAAFGLEVHPAADRTGQLAVRVAFDPYARCEVDAIIQAWLPVTFALNSVNRAMGLRDLYPFILSPGVIGKLAFIHGLVQGGSIVLRIDIADIRPRRLVDLRRREGFALQTRPGQPLAKRPC